MYSCHYDLITCILCRLLVFKTCVEEEDALIKFISTALEKEGVPKIKVNQKLDGQVAAGHV